MNAFPTTADRSTESQVRVADSRGTTRIGWLDSRHSFSFGGYYDPRRMGFHGLRVINDDRIAAGQGFDTHPHRDMEILTWVLDGELAHRDSMGHASSLGAGGLQLMSAGSGVTHSEFNAQTDAPVHLLQIWMTPQKNGTPPRYQEAVPDPASRSGRLVPLATPEGRDGSLILAADAAVYVGDFADGQADTYRPAPGRAVYLHVATGGVVVDGQTLSAGDALALDQATELNIRGDDPTPGQVLLFDLPA